MRDFDEYKSKLPYPAGSYKDPAVKAARDAYNTDTQRLLNEFQADLAKEYGVTGNPKEPLLFSKAWELGHAYGVSEVASHYDDLVCLIK